MPYAAIWRKPSTATPTSWDSTTRAASRGETILRATVDATQTTSMRTKPWLKAAPSASGRRCPVVSRGEDERVGVSIEVHHHARQQGAALVKLAEIEIADLEGEVRRNVLQLAVLVDLPLVVLRSELEVVNVRRVQNRLWQANG